MKKSNGYVIHESEQIVAIATGFARKSKNPKTGNMVQVWILVKDQHPLDAIKTGNDSAICGSCPARGTFCYVQVGQAPSRVWKTYRAGGYPVMTDYTLFQDRMVRFGAYGDPVFIPFDIVRKIASIAKGWTGYTHQWRNPLFAAYRNYVMASTENLAGTELAHKLGWRTFRVAPVGDMVVNTNEIVCVNTQKGITCADCGLCDGMNTRAKSIVIEAHGAKKRAVKRVA